MLTDLKRKTAEAIVKIFETGAALGFLKSATCSTSRHPATSIWARNVAPTQRLPRMVPKVFGRCSEALVTNSG
jgi:hypothetical protein